MRQSLTALLFTALLAGCSGATPPPTPAPTPPPLTTLDIPGAQAALRSGALRCVDLIDGYLARIRAYDQPTGLNAIIRENPRARARAAALDARLATGAAPRALHCIPVILKDNFDTHDLPVEAGSMAMRGAQPPDDATLVRRLRAADAIVIAQSNMGEWAFSPYQTVSSSFGETRNPYDLSRVPAGSSGGSAAAIAAGFGIIGMGSDTGNSIRGPASHTGLVGLRPTLGATSRDGIVPLLANRDIGGALTRSVRDSAIVFDVIKGPDPADPATAASADRLPARTAAGLDRDALNGVRLGVLRALVEGRAIDPEVLAAFEQALRDLAAAGAEIIDPLTIPDLDRLTAATGFCSRFRHDLHAYLRTLGAAAPIRDLAEVVASGDYLPQSEAAMRWALTETRAPQAMDPPCVDVDGDPRRRALRDAVVAAMDAAGVRALLYPTWNFPPRQLGDLTSPHGNNSPVIAPHSGQPALTVPMGWTATGLPLGLQWLGRPWSDGELLALGHAYAQHTAHRRTPSAFPELTAVPVAASDPAAASPVREDRTRHE